MNIGTGIAFFGLWFFAGLSMDTYNLNNKFKIINVIIAIVFSILLIAI